jgi:hypothetical protein
MPLINFSLQICIDLFQCKNMKPSGVVNQIDMLQTIKKEKKNVNPMESMTPSSGGTSS